MTPTEIDALLDATECREIRQHAKRFIFIATNFKSENISHKGERYFSINFVLPSGFVTTDVDNAMDIHDV